MAFALSGFFASFAGGLLALHQQALGEAIFAPVESIRVLTMVVVGGLGSVPGAILGAIFIKSTEWFQDVVPQSYRFLFTFAGSGIGLILVLWLLPGGLGSLLYQVRDAVAAPGRRPPSDRRAVAHRRHRRRPRAAHRSQGQAGGRGGRDRSSAPTAARSGCTASPTARCPTSTTSATRTSH